MVLFATSILACQFLPTHLPIASAAEQAGLASVYSHESGSRTASGERLNPGALTAAHRSFPIGSKGKGNNKRNGQSGGGTGNDRGPFVRGRGIDGTPAARQGLRVSR